MKKIGFLIFVTLSVFISSCLESELRQDSPYKEIILNYFDLLRQISDDTQELKINKLVESINFREVEVYELRTTEKLIVASVKTVNDFDDTDKIKVIFFLNKNKIVRSNIVTFKNTENFSDYNRLILSILNMNIIENEYSGRISFFSPVHNLLLFDDFEKGMLQTNGIVRLDNSVPGGKTNACIDWYLITTYYYSNGSTRTTEQYLYTLCGCEEEASRMGRVNCEEGGGGSGNSGSGSNGPVFPANPQNNDEYEYTDPIGKYTLYRFNSLTNSWVIAMVILPPATIVAEPENYPFLDIEWPVHGQRIFGDDNLLYTYDGFTGNWKGMLNNIELWEDQINDQNLRPCMQSILTDVINQAQGSLGQIIQRFAGNIPGYNWEVRDGSLPGFENASTSTIFNTTTGTVTTTFDANKMTNATNFSIARTVIHESIHAYVVAVTYNTFTDPAQRQSLLGPDWGSVFLNYGHDYITNNYLTPIADALEQYGISRGQNLPRQFYDDLAWGGLTNYQPAPHNETTLFQQMVPNATDRARIRNTISIEQTGNDTNGTSKTQKGTNAGC